MSLQQVLFWLLVFFLPTQLGRHFWPESALVLGIRVDYLAPTIYLTDLLILGVLLSWVWAKRNQFTISRYWWVGIVFVYLFLTSLLAQNPGAAFYKLGKMIEFSLLGFYVTKNNYTLAAIRQTLPWAIVYSSLVVIFQFLKQGSLGRFFWWLGERTFNAGTPGIALVDWGGRLFLRPYGTFSHPNSMSGFLLVALVLVWGLGKNLSPGLKIISTALGLIALVLSFSRAAWLAGMLVGLWFMVNSLLGKKFQGLFTMVVVGAFLFFLNLTEPAVQERIWSMKMAIGMIQVNLWGGVGLNNFIAHLSEFWTGSGIYFLQPVHNIFLLVAAETGLIGFMVFFWFLWLSFKRNIIYRQKYLLFSLLVILLTGFLDHYWLTLQQNILLATIVFGLIWGKMKT